MASVLSTELAPGMKVRRADLPAVLAQSFWGGAFLTVDSAPLVAGWVRVRFANGTGVDARPDSLWEVQA